MTTTDPLPWFRSLKAKTPFVTFERWRLGARIGIYGYFTLLTGAIVWAIVSPNEFISWMLARPPWVRITLVNGAIASFFVVPGVVMRYYSARRRAGWFSGRCLNCGHAGLSENLHRCFACGSDLTEQDIFRRTVLAPLPLTRHHTYRGVTRQVPELAPHHRRVVTWGVICAAIWVAFVAALVLPPFATLFRGATPGDLTSLGIAAFLVTLCVTVVAVAFKRIHDDEIRKINLRRLDGRCLHCETKVQEGDDLCPECGCSLVLQRVHRSSIVDGGSAALFPRRRR